MSKMTHFVLMWGCGSRWSRTMRASTVTVMVLMALFEIVAPRSIGLHSSTPPPINAETDTDADAEPRDNSSSYIFDSILNSTANRNPCRLIGDSLTWASIVPLDGKPLIVVSHPLFDVSDGVVPAITYKVSVTIPSEHEFTLEYSLIGGAAKEDKTTASKHSTSKHYRHQRERKHEELIVLDVTAGRVPNPSPNRTIAPGDGKVTSTSLDNENEIVICSKNSIGSFKSSSAPSNTYTFDWWLPNSLLSTPAKVAFRLHLKSSSDETNSDTEADTGTNADTVTVLEQIVNVNIKSECNLRLYVNEPTLAVSMSSLWNSRADNLGLACTLALIPRPHLGLEVTVSQLSIHGVRELCTGRFLSFTTSTNTHTNNEQSQPPPRGRGGNESRRQTLLPASSSIKFCGKLEDYSLDERTLTFTPQIKHKQSQTDDGGSESDLELGESEQDDALSVSVKVMLPGIVKSRETFSLQISSLSPCQKVFLPDLNGTLKYQVSSESDSDNSQMLRACSITIHVPYGNTILTELSVSVANNSRGESRENTTRTRTSPFIEFSPLDSISLENLIITDPTLGEEPERDCSTLTSKLIIHALDVGVKTANLFCFETSSSSLSVDEQDNSNTRIWNSQSNQIRLTFNLNYFNQIIISYKTLPISEVIGDCDDGWINIDNGCVRLVEKAVSWMDAEKDCQKQRSHLITLRNEYASKEIEKLLLASPRFNPGIGFWIGANDRESEGNFQWSSGLPFVYSNWFSGWWRNGKEVLTAQPNDDGLSRQDCVEIREALSSITLSRFQPRTQQRTFTSSNMTWEDNVHNANEQSNVISDSSQLRFSWNDRNCDAKNFYICEKEIERVEDIRCNQTMRFGPQQLSPVTITSPSYPSQYPDNMMCFITIETLPNYKIVVNFDEFVLEDSAGCSYDSLELIEKGDAGESGESTPRGRQKRGKSSSTTDQRVTRVCGDWTAKLKLLRYSSNSSALIFKFESDFSHHFPGFRATVSTEKDATHDCSDQKMLTFQNACYLFVSSPTLNWKAAQQTCTASKGHLASVLSFEEWNFVTRTLISTSNFDKRSMFWLGGSIDQSNQLLVWTDRAPFNFSAFHQSDLQSLADWKCLTMYWHRGPKEMYAWKLADCKQNSGYICKKNKKGDGRRNPIGRTFSGTGGKLASVNYPSNYYDNLDYTNHLVAPAGTRIIIRFSHLDLEPQADCLYDYVEFIDRRTKNSTRVCGSYQKTNLDRFDFLSWSNQVDIKFHSDYSDNFSGFELIWTAIDVTSCLSEKQIILSAPTGSGSEAGYGYAINTHEETIHTPNFPYFNLRGVNCVFSVVAPAGYRILLTFDIFEVGRNKLDAGLTSSAEDKCGTGDNVVIELGDGRLDNETLSQDKTEEGFIRLCGNLTSFPQHTTFVSFQEKMRLRVVAPEGRTGRGFLGKLKAIPMNFQEHISVPLAANASYLVTSLNYPLSPPRAGNLTMSFTLTPNYFVTLRTVGISSPNCHLTATSFLSFHDPYNGANGTSTIICHLKNKPLLLAASSSELDELDDDVNSDENGILATSMSIPNARNGNQLEFTGNSLPLDTLATLPSNLIALRTTFNRFELTQVYTPEFGGEKWSAEVISSVDDQFRSKVLAGGDRLLLLDRCTPNPCINGGQCVTEDNKHICRCQLPFTGPFCGLTLCDLNPCLFGQCLLEGTSFKCVCQMGYGGERCDRSRRPCDDKPCTGHGECVELDNSTYKCHCFAFWQGPSCEERMQNIRYKPLSERMISEPFWLGIITVFVVLGIIGLVFCLRRHFPEKLEKLLNEDLDKTRGISWVSGRSPSSLALGSCGNYGMRESIAGMSQQSTSPQTTRSFLGRFGIRKPSLLSLSSANSAISAAACSPHKYETRTFSLDDLLRPSRSMMMRTPSPHRRRNFSIHGRRDPVEKQQILQQLVSSSVHSSLDGECKPRPRKPTIGEIIQMSEKRLRLASMSSMQQPELALSPSPSIATEVETSFSTPASLTLAQQKAEKKVTFARLLDKLTTKELSSSSSMSDISCPEDKIMIPIKIPAKKDRKGRFRRSKSYHRGRTSETESQDGMEMSSSDTTPDPIYTPKFPSRLCGSPTGLSVSATNSPTPKQSKSLSKIPSADSLLALFRKFSGSSSAPPSPQYSENEESSIGATPSSTPGSPRSSLLSLNIRPPAFHITTSEPTTVEVPVIDAGSTTNWRSAQTACITLEVPLRDYCLSPIHEVPTPLPTPSHSPANSPMMQRQQPTDVIPVIQIQASSEAEGDDEHDQERNKNTKQTNTGFSSLPFSISQKSFEIPVISISTDDDANQQTVLESDPDDKPCKFGRRRKRGSETESLPDVLIHVPPDVPSESAYSDDSLPSPDPDTPRRAKNKPPPLVFANEILSHVKKDDENRPREYEVPILNVESATPIMEQNPFVNLKGIGDKQDHMPDLMPHLKQSSWEPRPMTPPVIMINQNSEAESDSDTVVRRLLLRPNLTFLSPFAGTSDRVPSESNLSTSGYSSMASPCPSRCPSISPLCSIEMEEHLNHCQGCCKCVHYLHFRRSSLTPSSSRKSSLTTSRRCSLNGTPIYTSHLYENSELNFNENCETNLKDWNIDSAVETDHEHETANFPTTEAQTKAMSPISEEMKSIYSFLEAPPKNFPKSQSLDMNSSCGKQKTRLKGESLDSKLNSIDPASFQTMFTFNMEEKEAEMEANSPSQEIQQKLSPVSSRSDSPLSDRGGANKSLQVSAGLLTPGTDTDGVYDGLSSEVPGNSSTFNIQNISPQQQMKRSGRRRNRRMSAGTGTTQNKNLLGVHHKPRTRTPDANDKESPESLCLLQTDLRPHGLHVGTSPGSTKRSSPKRRVRAQPHPGSSTSSSVESLNSLRSNPSSPGHQKTSLHSESEKLIPIPKSEEVTQSSDKPPRARPKVSRLKTISLQIRFLRRLEQNLIRKKENLARFAHEPTGRRFSGDSRKDSTSSCSSSSSCGSSCSCTDRTDELQQDRSDDSDEQIEVDAPLLGSSSSSRAATKRNAQNYRRT